MQVGWGSGRAPYMSIDGCPLHASQSGLAGGFEIHLGARWSVSPMKLAMGLEPFYVYHQMWFWAGESVPGELQGFGLRGTLTVNE